MKKDRNIFQKWVRDRIRRVLCVRVGMAKSFLSNRQKFTKLTRENARIVEFPDYQIPVIQLD